MYKFYKVTKAICNVDYPKNHGYILFTQYDGYTEINMNLTNLPPGMHGMHIHESSDRRNGCQSTCSHYNPYGGIHKNVNEDGNHMGDLGNINVDPNGNCEETVYVNNLPLVGNIQVIGRCIVIHADKDDLGLGNTNESIKTGSSGPRIACGVIGYL